MSAIHSARRVGQPQSSVPSLPNTFALDLFRFGVYTFPQGVAGAMSFHDPLEGTETKYKTEHINKYKK